jgi:hypothetical protein
MVKNSASSAARFNPDPPHYAVQIVYFLHDIIQVSKSRRVRWAGHVEFWGQKQNTYRALMRKPEGKDQLVEVGVDRLYHLLDI